MNKKTIIISSILIILISGGAFYWFQWRPTEIKKECFRRSDEVKNLMIKAQKSGEQIDYTVNYIYKNCLRENGIEK